MTNDAEWVGDPAHGAGRSWHLERSAGSADDLCHFACGRTIPKGTEQRWDTRRGGLPWVNSRCIRCHAIWARENGLYDPPPG